LAKLPGVGKKTAERLVIDMRDKVDDPGQPFVVGSTAMPGAAEATGPRREAFNALTALGYKPAEARRMLDGLDADLGSTEEILRNVLQTAASGSR
jgi:Holliday junction DNA helicase RuvA